MLKHLDIHNHVTHECTDMNIYLYIWFKLRLYPQKTGNNLKSQNTNKTKENLKYQNQIFQGRKNANRTSGIKFTLTEH